MTDVDSTGASKRNVFAPPRWTQPINQLLKLFEVATIQALSASQGKGKPMGNDRKAISQKRKQFVCDRVRIEEMVGGNFEEVQLRLIPKHIGAIGIAIRQSDTKVW